MPYMRAGNILNVDLTTGQVKTEPIAPYSERFLGGHGIDLKILYDRVRPEIKPFDPENVLIFGSGPFTGTMVPGSGRTAVGAKSPQTGLMGRANFGGYWSPELKFAGYDHLAITGKATKPVYIAINNDRIEIRDATHLWGMDTYQTPRTIQKDLGDPDVQVVCIGPGGENLVVFATVISELGHGGGKTGMGAVMGSKNLKAVAVRGTKGVKIADPQKFMEACLEADRLLRENPRFAEFSTVGTTNIPIQYHDGSGVLGNYQSTHWAQAEESNITKFWEKYGQKKVGCFNCPVQCMEYYFIPEFGPSVASCVMYLDLTWGLQNADTMRWYELNCQCQKYGIDPTSTVGMINWAVELYEKGIINEKDTGGVPMVVGSKEATVGMIEKIVKREGFGNLLASGVDAAVTKIGRDSEDYMIHVKGMPLVHGNRFNFRGSAIASATGNRGDWVAGRTWAPGKIEMLAEGLPEAESQWVLQTFETALKKHGLDASSLTWDSYEGKAALMALQRKLISVTDMLLNCKFHSSWLMGAIGIELQARLLSAGEGRDWSIEELFKAGERIHALERAYNIREGFTREDDTLPKRFFERPMPGFFPDDILDHKKFEQMKDEYYETMRWDVKTGLPTRETLVDLSLDDVAADLEKRGLLPSKAEEAVT